jgi:hypothetical protein
MREASVHVARAPSLHPTAVTAGTTKYEGVRGAAAAAAAVAGAIEVT